MGYIKEENKEPSGRGDDRDLQVSQHCKTLATGDDSGAEKQRCILGKESSGEYGEDQG